MDKKMGLPRRSASAKASGPQGHQSTGLSLCCNRYGLVQPCRWLAISAPFITCSVGRERGLRECWLNNPAFVFGRVSVFEGRGAAAQVVALRRLQAVRQVRNYVNYASRGTAPPRRPRGLEAAGAGRQVPPGRVAPPAAHGGDLPSTRWGRPLSRRAHRLAAPVPVSC
jgi:hypothetical protein